MIHLHSLGALLLVFSVLTGCLRVTEEDTTGEQVLIRAMPTPGQIRDAEHGKELWFAYGAIVGANGGKANGVATAHFLQDGTYVLGIQLNVAQPGEGVYYEGWLMNAKGQQRSVGHFVQGHRESRQTLHFRDAHDLRDFLKIAITSEKDDANPAPGDLVAEGVLRVTER